jgi:hypothetical protein
MRAWHTSRRLAVSIADRNPIRTRREDGRVAASPRAFAEPLESRCLLAANIPVLVPDGEGLPTLLVTTDNNNNNLRFATLVSTLGILDLWDQQTNIHYPIPLASFDRIDVRMGAAPEFNYIGWVDEFENWAGSLSKPADLDLGAGAGRETIMFFYTSGTATLSGDGRTGAAFNRDDVPLRGTVTYKNTPTTHVIGSDTPDYFDASGFTGMLSMSGVGGDDTLLGGLSGGAYSGGEGNDVIDLNGIVPGHQSVNAGPGNDIVYCAPTASVVAGGDGDDTIYDGGEYNSITGGSGNDTYHGFATAGADVLTVGNLVGYEPTCIVTVNNSRHLTSFHDYLEHVTFDAGTASTTPSFLQPRFPDRLK